ncbi:MAG: hypothetical protein ACOH2A_14220 [Sphingobacteriaceae bacterium]
MCAKSQTLPGSRFTAMGNAAVALSDVWSIQQNQAGLAAIKKITLAIAYENRFFQQDLTTKAAVLSLPFKGNCFGISFQTYGFEAYADQKIGFAFARNFGKKLAIALNLNYHQLYISKYGNASTFSFETGMQYRVNDKFIIGAHIANPNKSDYDARVNAQLLSIYRAGGSYIFSDKITLSAEINKIADYGTDINAGLSYQFFELLTLRGGISAQPFKQYAGFGLHYQQLFLDFAVSSHPVLGYSPQMALAYEF